MNKSARCALPLVAAAIAAPMISAQSAETAHAADETTITAFTTGYTWFDNTPAGSAQIAYPIVHSSAGGTGTWSNPITLANRPGRFAPGTRFYIPSLRRYFVSEDTGAGDSRGTDAWLDLWIGGAGGSASGADSCAGKLTGRTKVIVNPSSNYDVKPGPIYDGSCHGGWGDALVTKSGSEKVSSESSSRSATRPRRVASDTESSSSKSDSSSKESTSTKSTTKAETKPAPVVPKRAFTKASEPFIGALASAPSGRVVAAAKPAVSSEAYSVRQGDTLDSIAKSHGTTWQSLFGANRQVLKSPSLLSVGQKLLMP